MRLFSCLSLSSLLMISGAVVAQQPVSVDLIAVGRIAGDLHDLSGLSGTLETDTPADQLGGFSAIEYSGEGSRYFVLSDRGPGDGAASFACRVQEFELKIDSAGKLIQPLLRKTILLKNESGQQLNGSLASLSATTNENQNLAFDCEGLRLVNSKSIVVTDEYGPSVRLFSIDGRQQQRWSMPVDFKLCAEPTKPGVRGTYPNRGLEGVALSTDGATIVAAMQGPLVQDGVIEGEKCLGVNTRWLMLDSRNSSAKATQQFVYPLTDETTGVSEVLAVDADRYLVLERDSDVGLEAKIKHIYLADTRGATDVSSVASLGRNSLPTGVKPISKRLLIDLRDERFGLGGELTAGKPEGLSWGPGLSDGRRMLMVCVDNDFEIDRQSEFYAFAVGL